MFSILKISKFYNLKTLKFYIFQAKKKINKLAVICISAVKNGHIWILFANCLNIYFQFEQYFITKMYHIRDTNFRFVLFLKK